MQALTVATNFTKVHRLTSHTWVGLTGLASDAQTFMQHLRYRAAQYKYKENRELSPATASTMITSMLYEKRFSPWFIEPVIAGLVPSKSPAASTGGAAAGSAEAEEEEEVTWTTYLAGSDLVGAGVSTQDFIVGGTPSDNLYGMAESLWRPDMDADELFETISQTLLSAVDRDALSGWGALVYVITPEGTTVKELKARQD